MKLASSTVPTFREAFRFWLKLGFISFGGPAGQIAIMHSELVERKRWIDEAHFLHALNFCMFLPGPEATQLATYCGWLFHRTWGGIVAGVFFVLPSALLIWLLSFVYVSYGQLPWIAAIFMGLKPAVTAIVVAATWKIGSRALRNLFLWVIATAAFIGIFFFAIPFPLIMIASAVLGLVGGRLWPDLFPVELLPSLHCTSETAGNSRVRNCSTAPSTVRALRVTITCLTLWWLPVAAVALWRGPTSPLVDEALFFSKASLVTFGGAYSVLPYVAQQAVAHYHWLTSAQMLDGLALAETTPGPLIIVVQFVGFIGAWAQPSGLTPLVSATLGSILTTWTTFVPCFFWVFLGAPYVERIRGNRTATHVLTAVTAAVVGVIANLAVWFAGQALFPKFALHAAANSSRSPSSFSLGADWPAIAIAVLAFLAMHRFRIGAVPIVLVCALVGLVRQLA